MEPETDRLMELALSKRGVALGPGRLASLLGTNTQTLAAERKKDNIPKHRGDGCYTPAEAALIWACGDFITLFPHPLSAE